MSEPVSYNGWQDNGLLPGGVPQTIADEITNHMVTIQEPRNSQPFTSLLSSLCCLYTVSALSCFHCIPLTSVLLAVSYAPKPRMLPLLAAIV